ncbi:lysyl-tRNA synthetase [Myxozyma melibiosi]|uniref:Lysyl-tRNA synthetase n=1 Tax=Myxozyma melibiosi TaxID=54550 RepID=A0ABR1FEX7_9ASCO
MRLRRRIPLPSSARILLRHHLPVVPKFLFSSTPSSFKQKQKDAEIDYPARLQSLLAPSSPQMYPLIAEHSVRARQIRDVRAQYDNLSSEELQNIAAPSITVCGRIRSVRASGKNLVFLDIEQDESKIQGVYRRQGIEGDLDPAEFAKSWELLRRGDFISFTGHIARTKAGELSLRATDKVTLLSPCLHPLPLSLSANSRSHHRTVDFIINPRARETIRARAHVLAVLRQFLDERGFIEVQTPILSDSAGGATARPFKEKDTRKQLALRVAPELWLKRLLVGGFDRVYEVGPVFRNEGIDSTHNPEFTTCEFYMAFASLEQLVEMTEGLLREIVKRSCERSGMVREVVEASGVVFDQPFRRVDFVGEIERGIGCRLPDSVLSISGGADDAAALEFFEAVFNQHKIPIPSPLTVARYLDKLADHFLEPLLSSAKTPVFLLNFPESVSPLAKSTTTTSSKDGRTHNLARRFELYLNGKELVNAYEEENSPFAQRTKFAAQQRDREKGDAETPLPDEAYLKSMEWGLPPTGGWGMGIDRLVMFLTGQERIVEVLTFGGVKNVVGQE